GRCSSSGRPTTQRSLGRGRTHGEPAGAAPKRAQARADRAARQRGERDGGRRAVLALPDARAATGGRAPAGRARAALAPGSARARSPARRAPRAPVGAAAPGGGWGRMATIDENLRRVPPQSLEAEESVLGGIMLDNTVIDGVVGMLQPEDFYRGAHRKLFRAMVDLSERSEPVDLITLAECLMTRGELDVV